MNLRAFVITLIAGNLRAAQRPSPRHRDRSAGVLRSSALSPRSRHRDRAHHRSPRSLHFEVSMSGFR